MNNDYYNALHRCFMKSLMGAATLATGEIVAQLHAYRDYEGEIFVAVPILPHKGQFVVVEDRIIPASDIADVTSFGYRTRYATTLTLTTGEKIEFFLR